MLAEEYVNAINLAQFDPTILYMAPEQSGRINHSIDFRSNLYSLGAIFFEILTGRPPFESDDPVEIIHSHISKSTPSISQLNTSIPASIENIVLKLLQKSARKCYQSCSGLIVDLKRCLTDLDNNGSITDFQIGEGDKFTKLAFPQRLYGRAKDTEALLACFEEARLGGFAMALIAGYSGIGKSALVAQIHKPILQHRGYFVSGKYDQLQKSIPYSALLSALRQLSLQALSEADDKLAINRAKLLENLQGNGKLITDAIPESIPLIGKNLSTLPTLSAAEAQNRFRDTLAAFLLTFARAEHPLTLFIDDLQWADSATINFLSYLAQESENQHLFIIGAYRDNQVDGSHPLSLSIDKLANLEIFLTQIKLEPLSAQSVHHFVSDTLNSPLYDCQTLNEIIVDRTEANPFFIKHFIGHMVDNKWIVANPEGSSWLWDTGNFQGSCTFSYAANNTSFCGFSATAPQGRQFRVWPDHRLGFAALAS